MTRARPPPSIQTGSRLTLLTLKVGDIAPRQGACFYFSFISPVSGSEICSEIFIKYPVLIVIMIGWLRWGNMFAHQLCPSLHLRMWSNELIKKRRHTFCCETTGLRYLKTFCKTYPCNLSTIPKLFLRKVLCQTFRIPGIVECVLINSEWWSNFY